MLLYSAVEASRNLISNPLEKTSKVIEAIFSPPYPLGFMHGAKEIKSFFDLTARINKSYEKPEWKINSCFVQNQEFIIEKKDVLSKPFGNLIHFEKKEYNKEELPTLLIVAPMSGHYPTLLRDTVKKLLPTHDVFLTEWINARDVPLDAGDFSLDDYVKYIMNFLRELHSKGRKVHMMAVCQPTVPVLMAQSLMAQRNDPAQAKSLILIGGPVDARKSPTSVNEFGENHDISWFEQNLISVVPFPYKGFGRSVYPGFLQHLGFIAMNPTRHAKAHHKYFNDLMIGDESSAQKHREFYDEYNAVMDLPKTYYLQTIKKVFKDFDLPLGRMMVDNELVIPSMMKDCALLTIEGELDDISGAGQTHATHDLCSSIPQDKKFQKTFEGIGHYGVFSGSKFKEEIAPFISEFTKKFNS